MLSVIKEEAAIFVLTQTKNNLEQWLMRSCGINRHLNISCVNCVKMFIQNEYHSVKNCLL